MLIYHNMLLWQKKEIVMSEGLVGFGSLLEDAMKDVLLDLYREGSDKVAERVTKAPYDIYVSMTYDKNPKGFAIKGEVLLVEKLLNPVYVDGKGRGNAAYMDGLLLKALTVHSRYERDNKRWDRTPRAFYFTDDDAIRHLKYIKVKGYKPPCLLFVKVAGAEATKLLAKDSEVWEDYACMAEKELRERCRVWRRSRRAKKKRSA